MLAFRAWAQDSDGYLVEFPDRDKKDVSFPCPENESWVPADFFVSVEQLLVDTPVSPTGSGTSYKASSLPGPMHIECSLVVITGTPSGNAEIAAAVVATAATGKGGDSHRYLVVARRTDAAWKFQVVAQDPGVPEPTSGDGRSLPWGLALVESVREPIPLLVLIRPDSCGVFEVGSSSVDVYRLLDNRPTRRAGGSLRCDSVLTVSQLGVCRSVGSGGWGETLKVLDFGELAVERSGAILLLSFEESESFSSENVWREERSIAYRWDDARQAFREVKEPGVR